MGIPPAGDMGINPLNYPMGGKAMSEQKRLDRPELREKIKAIMADCTEYYQSDEYDLECSQEFFRSDKFFDQILTLTKAEIEQTIKDDADRCAGYMESAREEAKREGEERILKLAIENDILCSHIEAQEVNCKTCLAFWQALGEK